MTNDQLKAALVETIHFLHAQGWAPATSSNYSVLPEEGDRFIISQSGKDKGAFSTDDLMEVDRKGIPLDGNLRASAETQLHVMLYEKFAHCRCVLHTHSVNNTVLSLQYEAEEGLYFTGYELLKGLSNVKTHESKVHLPIFPNSQDIDALATRIGAYIDNHPFLHGFLLAGHGLYSWGETIAEAKRHIEVFEFLFDCTLKLQHHGSIAHT